MHVAAPNPPPSLSDQLSQRHFGQIATYIFDYAGIKMPQAKKTMLEGRLRRRQRDLGAPTLDAYCDYFFSDDNSADEGIHLINAVTTNKTDFFREPAHFDFLGTVVLPEFKTRSTRPLRAWSVACSTGPEPYTMAMVLDDFADRHGGPSYGILATDLDTEVLETALTGIYPAELVAPVPMPLRQKYVMAARDPKRHDVRIAPTLRSAVGFARLNLMDDCYPIGAPMDVIFCRNVLIYFDKPTQLKVVSQLAGCLAKKGYLFLGHSESIAGLDLPLTQVANTVFQRADS